MTRDEIRQQYFAETGGGSPSPASDSAPVQAVDPTASALTQMLQGGLSQPQNRNEIAASYATDPREAIGAGFGNFTGLVSSDNPRFQALNQAHPNYVAGGQGLGLGVDVGLGVGSAIGTPMAIRAAVPVAKSAGVRAGEMALRGGGRAMQGYSVYDFLHSGGDLGHAGGIFAGGTMASQLGKAMRAARMGDKAGMAKHMQDLHPQEIVDAVAEILKRRGGH